MVEYHAFFVFWGRAGVNISKILVLLDQFAPFSLAEPWDNSGLQIGHPDSEVSKIMIGLDVTVGLIDAAQRSSADLVLTHHPLMIEPENRFDFSKMPGSVIHAAAKADIAIISAHTNLDKAQGGLNDYCASRIGLTSVSPFVRADNVPSSADHAILPGCRASLDVPVSLQAFAAQIKHRLDLDAVRVIGNPDMKVQSIVLCTGSGGSLISDFIRSGADLFITGDIKYHDARDIEAAGRSLIDIGHFGSEHMAIDLLYERLKSAFEKAGEQMRIEKYLDEKDPFNIV